MYQLLAFKGAARQKGMKIIWYGRYLERADKNVFTCYEEGSFEFWQTGSPD